MRVGVVLGALTVLVRWISPTSASGQSPLLSSGTPPQDDFQTAQSDQISILSENIVSALSASSQHTTFLRLLQRSKSIPLLAHIGNATIFAPTDEAWLKWADNDRLQSRWLGSGGLDEWLLREEDVIQTRMTDGQLEEGDVIRTMDNQNWHLRQHLLYYMLNYTLSPYDLLANYTTGSSTNITTQTTLLFPMSKEPELPPTPPPGAPWLPRGGEGMLGGHGQRLRIAKAGSDAGGKRGKVGVDFNGENGVDVWDGKGWKEYNGTGLGHAGLRGGRWTRNGLVIGIDEVLDMPLSIDEIIKTHPALSKLAHLLKISQPVPDPLPDDLTTTPHLTIFAPSDEAFAGAFDEIENTYLEGPYGAEGVGRILAGGIVLGVGSKKEEVGWKDSLKRKEYQAESASGQDLFIEAPKNGSLLVNGSEATSVDIFASNGVIHIMPNLLLPETFTLLNSAEKVLLSVNATRFVSLLRTANLSTTYVGPPSQNRKDEEAWTILAPTDDVSEMMDRWGGPGVPGLPAYMQDEAGIGHSRDANLLDAPFKDSSPLVNLLKYHFLPGRLLPEDIVDGMLVDTELRTSALRGGRQRLRVEIADRLDPTDWDAISVGEIRFGEATVLGKPVKAGKSIIYLVSSLLSLPDDVLQTAVSDLQLSTFIAAIYAAGLERSVKQTPGITYIIPRNKAFSNLGLGMKYLLLPEGKDDLRKVVKYHAIEGVVYSGDVEGQRIYKTLEGGDIVLERIGRGDNATITVSSPARWAGHDSGDSLPSNGELRPARMTEQDALTDTGVIHTIDNVIMPADVVLTNEKLIRGSRQTVMAELMYRAGLSWVLQGREPSQEEISRAEVHGDVRTLVVDSVESGDIDTLAWPGFVVLCPSDKALSRINLTSYLQDPSALLDLLKLHIISTQPSTLPKGNYKRASTPPTDGHPLTMGDDLIYSTLLSGKSKFGDVAFRATGDNTYLVGIRGARGRGVGEVARIGQSGRASVRWRRRESLHVGEDDAEEDNEGDDELSLWRGGMSLGGGVMLIDSVLIPYEPSWFSRWGWLVIVSVGLGVILVGAGCAAGYWWMTKGKKEEYEPLEGEEEE